MADAFSEQTSRRRWPPAMPCHASPSRESRRTRISASCPWASALRSPYTSRALWCGSTLRGLYFCFNK